MFHDFKELLSIFHAHGVRYLIVGGYAVSFHAHPRATKDLDLLIKPSIENASAVYAALAAFGAPLDSLTVSDFADRTKFFRIGREPVMIDILPEIEGVNFGIVWEKRIDGIIDSATGQQAFFISSDDLVTAKLAAGRPQHIADAAAIRIAAEKSKKSPSGS